MNGMRMNQSVAPTSFITSISRRRANIAVRIVFQISSTAGEHERDPQPVVYIPTKLCSLLIRSIWSSASFTLYTPADPRYVAFEAAQEPTSVPSVGNDLEQGRDVRLVSSWRDVGSPASTRSASSSEHSTSQYSQTRSMTDLLVERLSMNVQIVGSRAGVDEHDHLDTALPRCEEVVEAVLDEQREPEDQQRHGRR